jgi:antitoxin FitA
MTTLTIRELDPAVERRLRDRAARHGHSIEEEVRHILQNVVGSAEAEPKNAYEAMRRHFRDLEGVDIELPARRPAREVPRKTHLFHHR